jgi:transmembrane sensor
MISDEHLGLPLESKDLPQAVRVNLEAAERMQKREFGEWTADDRAELEVWLNAAPENRVAFLRLEAGWSRSEIMVALRTLKKKETAEKRGWPWAGKAVAAALVTAMTGLAFAYFQLPTRTHAYTTPVGGREVITLSDGSQIELNTNTTLRISEERERRLVWLDKGEAYFQVVHNAKRPLIVDTGRYRVVDLGTKFSVRNMGPQVEVTLVEGRARFEADDGARHHRRVELSPGDVAVATAQSMSVVKKPTEEIADLLVWRRGYLKFHNTTLADAIADFNRYNEDKLIVGSPDVGRLRINGTFPVHDVPVFARVTQDVFGLRVSVDSTGTTLFR